MAAGMRRATKWIRDVFPAVAQAPYRPFASIGDLALAQCLERIEEAARHEERGRTGLRTELAELLAQWRDKTHSPHIGPDEACVLAACADELERALHK
jgi:hypothetical protein